MPAIPWLIGAFVAGGALGTVLGIKTEKIIGVVIIGGVAYYYLKGRR